MKSLGGLLVLLGIGSIILNQIGYEFALLMWIDNWGAEIGWGIRGGAIVLGAVLWLVGNSMEGSESSA